MSFEVQRTNQFGYTPEEWDTFPDEVKKNIVSENSTSVETNMPDDCCIPRVVGSRALGLSDVELRAEEDTPEITINERANMLLPEVRKLTRNEESKINRLYDTGQSTFEDAYRMVTGFPLSAYNSEDAKPFEFTSPEAIEIATQILNQEYPRLNKSLRPQILKLAIVDKSGKSQISSQEAEDLMRLIELRNKR